MSPNRHAGSTATESDGGRANDTGSPGRRPGETGSKKARPRRASATARNDRDEASREATKLFPGAQLARLVTALVFGVFGGLVYYHSSLESFLWAGLALAGLTVVFAVVNAVVTTSARKFLVYVHATIIGVLVLSFASGALFLSSKFFRWPLAGAEHDSDKKASPPAQPSAAGSAIGPTAPTVDAPDGTTGGSALEGSNAVHPSAYHGPCTVTASNRILAHAPKRGDCTRLDARPTNGTLPDPRVSPILSDAQTQRPPLVCTSVYLCD
jgi:hypothetical protein